MKDNWIDLYNRWLKKRNSTDEHHILERQALDDPFLADALEGIELYESRNTDTLQEKLESKLLSKKKNKLITLWPYATAASLLLIASVFFLLQSLDEPEGSVVLNEEVLLVNSEEVIAYQEAPEESKTEMSDEPENSYKKINKSTLQSQISQSDMAPNLDKSMIDISDESKPEIIRADKLKPQVSQVNTATEPNETVTKSSIGLQTGSLAYQSKDKNISMAEQDHASISIQSSKELSIPENSNTTTKKQKVSAATTTVASNRSYENMPVLSAKSSENNPNYRSSKAMIDIPNEMKNESNMSEVVLFPSQLEELIQDSQNSISDDSVAEVSNQQYFYHQGITNPTPKIGWVTFKDVIAKHMPDREWLFMRGIREGDKAIMLVALDSDNHYNIIETGGKLPIENIHKIMTETGEWTLSKYPDTLIYEYTITHKSN